MKNISTKFPVLFLVLVIAFFSCNDSSEVNTIELLDNVSLEEGNQDPFSWFDQSGDYLSEWTEDLAYEGTRSLKLISETPNGYFGYWGQSIVNDIPFGEKLRLSCQIKLEGVSGNGVYIAIRGDGVDINDNKFFYTTQGNTVISGDGDWKTYSVEMDDAVPDDTKKIWVFLILGGDTEGTVYFDNISLKAF